MRYFARRETMAGATREHPRQDARRAAQCLRVVRVRGLYGARNRRTLFGSARYGGVEVAARSPVVPRRRSAPQTSPVRGRFSMTERMPLSATTTDPIEQALLRSVRRDVPGPLAMQRTAAALGLSATAFTVASSSVGAVASSSAASGAVVSLPWIAMKAIVIGTLC